MLNVYQLKDTGYYINEDFSKVTLNIRTELWDEVKQFREKGYCAVIKHDRIIINGMKWRGNNVCSIKNLYQNIKH